MLLFQKKTFKEFVTSDEKVATNLLSSRLKMLESLRIITKQKLSSNKKENIYLLTEKGIELAPLIMELVLWSDKYVRAYNDNMNTLENETDKQSLIISTQDGYRAFTQQIIQ